MTKARNAPFEALLRRAPQGEGHTIRLTFSLMLMCFGEAEASKHLQIKDTAA
jgi:hypothetical protein